MSRTTFQWKPWARLQGDAQKVGEAIEAIEQEHGGTSPALVVTAATAPESVLHGFFEWDDAKAGPLYRETQAQHLLRSLVAVRIDGEDLEHPTRAFVSVRRWEDNDGGSYVSVREALRVVDYRKQLMRDAMRDLDAYRIKYHLLADLTGWRYGIEKARAALEKEQRV